MRENRHVCLWNRCKLLPDEAEATRAINKQLGALGGKKRCPRQDKKNKKQKRPSCRGRPAHLPRATIALVQRGNGQSGLKARSNEVGGRRRHTRETHRRGAFLLSRSRCLCLCWVVAPLTHSLALHHSSSVHHFPDPAPCLHTHARTRARTRHPRPHG